MFLCPKRRLRQSFHYSEIHFSLQWELFLTIVGFVFHYSETTDEAAVLAERTAFCGPALLCLSTRPPGCSNMRKRYISLIP